jgi:hypothetical protein
MHMDLKQEVAQFVSSIEEHIKERVREGALAALGAYQGAKGSAPDRLRAAYDFSKGRLNPHVAKKVAGRALRRCKGCGKLKHDLRNCPDEEAKKTKPTITKRQYQAKLAKLTPKKAA